MAASSGHGHRQESLEGEREVVEEQRLNKETISGHEAYGFSVHHDADAPACEERPCRV